MNAVWNLTEFSELQQPVVTELVSNSTRRSRRHSFISRSFAVVAFATSLAVMPVHAESSGQQFSVPCVEAAAYSGLEMESPLGTIFADRFSAEWTQAKENELLAQVHAARGKFTKAELEDQTVYSIYFNQHENPSEMADRLTAEQIRKVVRRRKLA